MRDKKVLDETDYLQPMGGVGGQFTPPVEGAPTIAEQVPAKEQDSADEVIAPDDDALLDAGSSPEFDHSLRRRKAEHSK